MGNVTFGTNGSIILAKQNNGNVENFMWPRWTDNITYMNYGSAGLNIRNNSSVSGMFITNDGKVGIGNTTPNGKVHIYESTGTAASTTSGSLVIEHGDTGGVSSIVFPSRVNNTSDFAYIQYYDTIGNIAGSEASALIIGIDNDVGTGGTGNADVIVLWADKGSGCIGVNTKSPQTALHVNGTTTSTKFNANSDYRLKTNIQPLIDKNVDQLIPIEYDIINGNHDMGFLAHKWRKGW